MQHHDEHPLESKKAWEVSQTLCSLKVDLLADYDFLVYKGTTPLLHQEKTRSALQYLLIQEAPTVPTKLKLTENKN